MKTILIPEAILLKDLPCSFGLMTGLNILTNADFSIYVSCVKEKLAEYLSIINEPIKLNCLNFEGAAIDTEVKLVNGKLAILDKYFDNFYAAVNFLTARNRVAKTARKTCETEILLEVDLDGNGLYEIETGIGFFNHMLEQVAKHSLIDINLKVTGDLIVDEHHTVEDVGIVFGEVIKTALGDKKGINRYGFLLPMDDSSTYFAVDISGRNYLNFKCKFSREFVGGFPTELVKEFFLGVTRGMQANILIKSNGENEHHKIESIFKAFGRSLKEACLIDKRNNNCLPTTKGVL